MTETSPENRTQVPLRLDADLLPEIDARCEQASKTTGRKISRNEWFNNMSRWIITSLPHQAVRSDLIEAWDTMPPEALRIDK